MENASKALIMSASILIGMIILSIAAYLFTTFGSHSRDIQQQVDTRVMAEFNNNFLKYQGSQKCTIHDIVNLAKFAQKTNEQLEVNNSSDFYIHVMLKTRDLTKDCRTEEDWTKLLNENSIGNYTNKDGSPKVDIKYYTCEIVEFKNQSQPNRVSSIVFRETSDSELKKDEM